MTVASATRWTASPYAAIRIVTRAFEETWALNEERDTGMRMAAYGLAVQRVAEATTTRGIYP